MSQSFYSQPTIQELDKEIEAFTSRIEAKKETYDLSEDAVKWAQKTPPKRFTLSCLPQVEKVVNGFRPSTLNMVVAKSGFGKSNFLINFAVDQATEMQPDGSLNPVLFFSSEMPEEILMPRLVARILDQSISSVESLQARMQKAETNAKEKYFQDLGFNLSLIPIDVSYEKNVDMIIARVAKEAQNGYLKHVVIDHFFELETSQQFNNDREKEVYIITQLQQSAEQYGICYVIATQFAKGGEKGMDFGERDLDSMRGASEIRNKAANVLYIYETKEQHEFNQNRPDWMGADNVTIRTLKARNGYEGKTVELKYFRNKCKFVENDQRNT